MITMYHLTIPDSSHGVDSKQLLVQNVVIVD